MGITGQSQVFSIQISCIYRIYSWMIAVVLVCYKIRCWSYQGIYGSCCSWCFADFAGSRGAGPSTPELCQNETTIYETFSEVQAGKGLKIETERGPCPYIRNNWKTNVKTWPCWRRSNLYDLDRLKFMYLTGLVTVDELAGCWLTAGN